MLYPHFIHPSLLRLSCTYLRFLLDMRSTIQAGGGPARNPTALLDFRISNGTVFGELVIVLQSTGFQICTVHGVGCRDQGRPDPQEHHAKFDLACVGELCFPTLAPCICLFRHATGACVGLEPVTQCRAWIFADERSRGRRRPSSHRKRAVSNSCACLTAFGVRPSIAPYCGGHVAHR